MCYNKSYHCQFVVCSIMLQEGGQMSTAMQIIERANRENKGIVIIISGREMERRIPICVRFKSNYKKGIAQETYHHAEELTLELDLRNGANKLAYVCDKNRTKVRVSEFLITDSVRDGAPAYAFLSAHVFTSLDELESPQTEGIPCIPTIQENHFGNEW